MIIKIDSGVEVDTDRDLSAEERHVLQKLFGWKTMVDSLEQFRQKIESALFVGWNNSGPIRASKALQLVIKQLEKELCLRLKNEKGL